MLTMPRNIFCKVWVLSVLSLSVTLVFIARQFRIVDFKSKSDFLYSIHQQRFAYKLHNRTYYTLAPRPATELCIKDLKDNRMRLQRDIFNYDASNLLRKPGNGSDATFLPGDLPNTVHYTWCGEKMFTFEDYLGVLSIVRVIKPVKLVFHYNKLPVMKLYYHTWFTELQQSLLYLVLRQTDRELTCNTTAPLDYGLELLASSVGGGIYFGERAVLTHIPEQWFNEEHTTYITPTSSGSKHVIIYSRYGHVEKNSSLSEFKSKILNNSYECISPGEYNEAVVKYNEGAYKGVPPCLALPTPLYPEHFINNTTPYGRLGRVLYYGKPDILTAKQGEDLAPAISHIISLTTHDAVNWTFPNYLSILSALYVGGFERVYVHGNVVPQGFWWRKLQTENVTFVFIENIETVFQQKVNVLAHQSDILRAIILYKYGGVYQDKDIFWANPIPEDIRRYPTVGCHDWPIYEEWPRSFNFGVMMSKSGAPFLKKFMDSFWDERDSSWEYNGVMMPYKVYERDPETFYIYKKLQIICYYGDCHPIWQDNYLRTYADHKKSLMNFTIDEPSAFHFTAPKPAPSLLSFSAIRANTDMAAKVGQRIIANIEKSGRSYLLQDEI
ncbi:uncharacterized protein LOC131930305 [Physella acuta]|uniref:uncharacterized protein LOC131930305 n=1 Tax=Physella acuta TaxID=109671 RepID=UPI0027DBB049|nr:uncharacterized protein LOC131930305 [Physella acuta]